MGGVPNFGVQLLPHDTPSPPLQATGTVGPPQKSQVSSGLPQVLGFMVWGERDLGVQMGITGVQDGVLG